MENNTYDDGAVDGQELIKRDDVPLLASDEPTYAVPNRAMRRAYVKAMGSKSRAQAAQTAGWNARRDENLENIASSEAPADSSCVRDYEGWFLVSRHRAGVASAYQSQNLLRKKWGKHNLVFKVINTKNQDTEWTAEIWARLEQRGIDNG